MKNKTKSRKKNKLQSSKKLTKKIFMKLEYPYRNIEITKKQMLDDFKKLKNYTPVIFNKFHKKITRYNNKIVIFKENYNLNKELYSITDYFSHNSHKNSIEQPLNPLQIKYLSELATLLVFGL